MIHSDANAHGRRQREARRPVAAPRPVGRGGWRFERIGHLRDGTRPLRGERQRPMPSLEQRDAERVFQRLDLPRQR